MTVRIFFLVLVVRFPSFDFVTLLQILFRHSSLHISPISLQAIRVVNDFHKDAVMEVSLPVRGTIPVPFTHVITPFAFVSVRLPGSMPT